MNWLLRSSVVMFEHFNIHLSLLEWSIQPRWLKFASLCLGSDSNLFEPAFRRQAWKFSASANLKWCSGQFQDNFETMLKSNSRLFQAQNYSLGRLKALTISKRCTRQIRGIDKLEMTIQTNLGLGSGEATGWWASWCPDMELEKIGLKPVSLFLRFLIWIFSQFWIRMFSYPWIELKWIHRKRQYQ